MPVKSLSHSQISTIVGFLLSVIVYFVITVVYTSYLQKEKTIFKTNIFLEAVKTISKQERWPDDSELIQFLDECYQFGAITAYSVIYRNTLVKEYPEEADKELHNINNINMVNDYTDGLTSRMAININNRPYDVRVALKKRSLTETLIANFAFQFLAIVSLLIGFLISNKVTVWFSRLPFLQIFKTVKSLNPTSIENLNFKKNTEESVILNYIKGQNERVNELQSMLSIAEDNLLTAKHWAINRTQHTEKFNCTHMRIDINQFMDTYRTLDETTGYAYKLIFYDWGFEIVKRYNSYVSSEKGDEFLTFTPESNNYIHQEMATHMVRTFFEEVDFLIEKLFSVLGSRKIVTLKAAIESDVATHFVENGKHSIQCRSQATTDRYLGNIENKTLSSLIFLEKELLLIEKITKNLKNVSIKDKKNVSVNYGTGYITSDLIGLQTHVIENQVLPQNLIYYRSAKDIVFMLKYVGDNFENDPIGCKQIIDHLKSISYGMILDTIYIEYTKTLAILSRTDKQIYLLTSLISLSSIIFFKSEFSQKVIENIQQFTVTEDKRLFANSKEALRVLSNYLIVPSDFIENKNNRDAANLLISYIKENGFDDISVETIKNWLKHENVFFQLSSLYVIYTSLMYIKKYRLNYYQINDGFPELSKLLLQFKNSNNKPHYKWTQLYINDVLESSK